MLVFGQESTGLTMQYMAALVETRVAVTGGSVDADLCQVVNVRSGSVVAASQCGPAAGDEHSRGLQGYRAGVGVRLRCR